MTYKKNFLSFVVCTLLLVQPIQSGQNPQKRIQTSTWPWKVFALTAASIPLILDYVKIFNNYLSKKKKRVIDFDNNLVDSLAATTKNDVFSSNDVFSKNDVFSFSSNDKYIQSNAWERIQTNKNALQKLTYQKALYGLEKNPQCTKYQININKLRNTFRTHCQNIGNGTNFNTKKNTPTLEESYLEAKKYYLDYYITIFGTSVFSSFLDFLEKKQVKDTLNTIKNNFISLQEKYYSILNNPNENAYEYKLKVEDYNNILMPTYAVDFNDNKNYLYALLSQDKSFANKRPQTNVSLDNFIYNRNNNSLKKETWEINLCVLAKFFLDLYIVRFEPKSTLLNININSKLNININSNHYVDNAVKLYFKHLKMKKSNSTTPPTPQQTVKIEEQKPLESSGNSDTPRVSLNRQSNPVMTPETLLLLKPNESATTFQGLKPKNSLIFDPENPTADIKPLPDYN